MLNHAASAFLDGTFAECHISTPTSSPTSTPSSSATTTISTSPTTTAYHAKFDCFEFRGEVLLSTKADTICSVHASTLNKAIGSCTGTPGTLVCCPGPQCIGDEAEYGPSTGVLQVSR